MKRTIALLTLAATVATGVATFAPAASATSSAPARYWHEFEAGSRLDTGRFAARHGIDYAFCNGFGPRKMEYGVPMYRTFDCEVTDQNYRSRDLVLTTTGATSFKVRWLNSWS